MQKNIELCVHWREKALHSFALVRVKTNEIHILK